MQRASFSASATRTATPTSIPGFEKHRKSAVKANLKFYLVGAVVAIAAVVIAVTAMQGSSVFYYTVGEFQDKQATLNIGEPMRVSGTVLTGSIKKDEVSRAITFTAIDKLDKTKSLTVTYSGILPDTFKDDADVVVTGTYGQGVFQAKEMLAKCPSKYTSGK
ncbi:MAG: cytochrome c maturation protein CcmE [Chloroflexota bacterium]|nr:cytochrome c maturation protein CcmE [Chloroflexota bacterium]